MCKLIILFTFFTFFFLNPTSSYANSEFTTSFTSEYTVEHTGKTSVNHTISLTNKLSHIYATTYTIATSGENLENIYVSDESGPLTSTINPQNGHTNIQISISRPSIGKDQTKTLYLSYQTNDIIETIGDTITINIPRLARANEAQSYRRIVKVRGGHDLPSLIFPPQSKTEPDGDYTVYTFDGHQNDSITLLFGDSVTYRLNLTYELRNKELRNIDSELALPPDTPYQQVILTQIQPTPLDIRLDLDGNWLARYNLKSQETLKVQAELYITVYPQPVLYDPSGTELTKTPNAKYWDTSSNTVKSLAEQLKSPKNIYDYITSNFTYNYADSIAGAPRKGAHDTLISPANVLCTEFTDSFVSLARTLDIPAREINGYGYTRNESLQPQIENSDILHSWPEYYSKDESKWLSVDPTWGNTTGGIDYFSKLDFGHIAFVRRGLEDSYPLPAGSYKSNPKDKYVTVEVSPSTPEKNLSFEIQAKDGKQYIFNNGNTALIQQKIELPDETIDLEYLPPYASYEVPTSHKFSLYDKIKTICADLLSRFLQLLPAST